jgi:uncharacterized protein YjbI with pentapeptide repeats
MSSPALELVCPITCDPIKVGGMTCHGSLYEYDAIVAWTEDNTTDPSTGQYLYTKFVKKLDDLNETTIKDCKKDINQSLNMWCGAHRIKKQSYEIWKKLDKLQETFKNSNFDNKKWLEYCKMKSDKLSENKTSTAWYNSVCQKPDQDDIIERPEGTGVRYNFIDLSNLYFDDMCMKGENFNFANLTNCVFTRCNLSRVQFIGANLTNTQFIECTFIGEDVSFYMSKCDGCTFVGCRMEYLDKWESTDDPDGVRKILESRECNTKNVVIM